MKICKKCKQSLTLDNFYKAGKYYQSLCKTCFKDYNNKRKEANPDYNKNYLKKYYQNHKKEHSTYQHNYYQENKEHIRGLQKKNYEENREKLIQYVTQWAKNNPDKIKATTHRRRSRIKGNGGTFSAKEWRNLCNYYGNVCVACYEPKPLQADHIVPISKGGRNIIENIQPLCQSCNCSKGTKTLDYRFWFMVA